MKASLKKSKTEENENNQDTWKTLNQVLAVGVEGSNMNLRSSTFLKIWLKANTSSTDQDK